MKIIDNSLAPPSPARGLAGATHQEGAETEALEFSSLVKRAQKGSEGAEKTPSQNPKAKTGKDSELRGARRLELRGSHKKTEDQREVSREDSEEQNGSEEPKVSRNKKNAIRRFMDSLESELGISAERLSAAIAQVPADVKGLSLSESAPFVIDQLGLTNPLVKGEALNQYLDLAQKEGLLGGTVEAETSPLSIYKDAEASIAAGKPSLESAQDRDLLSRPALVNRANSEGAIDISTLMHEQKQKLNASIDELNRRFFDTQRGQELASSSNGPQVLSQRSMENQATLDRNLRDENNLEVQSANDSLMSQADLLGTVPAMSLKDLEVSLDGPQRNSIRPWTVEELPYLTGEKAMGLNSLNNLNGEMEFSGQQQDMGDSRGEALNGRLMANEWEQEGEGTSFSLPLADRPMMQNELGAFATPETKTQGIDSPIDRSANIERLKSAAESLAARGGGEVKVILQPEGLGTVQLKVRLHEGKIQVQMNADNQESQKLLESSLGDLRQSLSSQKIAVESVKVDVGGDSMKQDQSSNFNSQNFDQGREQARQFMSQFRQENFFQRQPMFDAPGFKTYRSQRDESVKPVSEDVRPRAVTSRGTGREINVVA